MCIFGRLICTIYIVVSYIYISLSLKKKNAYIESETAFVRRLLVFVALNPIWLTLMNSSVFSIALSIRIFKEVMIRLPFKPRCFEAFSSQVLKSVASMGYK